MLSAATFRRLAFLTASFAYLQIALGGVVRVTDSGLGCPDWPLCHGRPYPAADIHSIIEYSHRTVGTITGVLVVVHLALAMIILGFLIATAVVSLPSTSAVADASFRRLAALAAAATYVLLLTGSTVVASSADESCRAWPLCGNGFAFDFAGANALTMLHRGAVLFIGILLVYVLRAAIRHQATRRAAVATAIVFALQVAVGAGSALTDASFF